MTVTTPRVCASQECAAEGVLATTVGTFISTHINRRADRPDTAYCQRCATILDAVGMFIPDRRRRPATKLDPWALERERERIRCLNSARRALREDWRRRTARRLTMPLAADGLSYHRRCLARKRRSR